MALKIKKTAPTPRTETAGEARGWTPGMSKGRQALTDTAKVAGSRYLGIVVNPKTLRPYFVYDTLDNSGAIAVPSTGAEVVIVAHGYLEDDERSGYALPAKHFNMPRVHTPGGVAEKGTGLGTVLYAGMAIVGAYASEMRPREVAYPGPGICSGEGASPSARAWWKAAVRVGLADEDMYPAGEIVTEPETQYEDEWMEVNLSNADDTESLAAQVEDASYEQLGVTAGPEAITSNWHARQRSQRANVTLTWPAPEGEKPKTFEVEVEWDTQSWSHVRLGDVRERAVNLAKDAYEEENGESADEAEGEATEVVIMWRLEMEWSVGGETEEQRKTGFAMPISRPIEQGLILDMNPELEDALGYPLSQVSLKSKILSLDLSEVLDPSAVRYFYGLAEDHGASLAELNRFRNRTEAARSYFTSFDIPRREEAWNDLRDRLEEHGLLVNPVGPDHDYEAEARRLYGDLADL